MTDQELHQIISRVRGGEVNAFGQLVLEFQVPVRAYLAARLDDPHEAEDLAQEVFLVAFRRIHEFGQTRPMSPWLRGIASNLLRNHLRHRREKTLSAQTDLSELLEQNVDQLEEEADGSRMLPALRTCLQMLDGRARKLVESRYARGSDLAEISRQMQLKHSALTMALHRLRQRLRDCITRRLAGEGVAR